jgi:hypothetical protein
MLLLAALLQSQAPSLQVTRVIRITDAPGMRDNAVAVSGAGGMAVFWEQSPGFDRGGAVLPPVQIWRARFHQGSATSPEPFITGHANQWYPAVSMTGHGAMIVYYAAEATRRTGDRDIMVQAIDSAFNPRGDVRRVTQDGDSPLPLNDATPAITQLQDGRTLLAWSRGAFDERTGKSEDKDLMLAVLDAAGSVRGISSLTGRHERGHEASPALAQMRDGGTMLVYVSDSAANGRPSLYSMVIGPKLKVSAPHRLTPPDRGVTRPSLARAGSRLWLSWYDLEANDVRIARVLSNWKLTPPVSLRELLLQKGFEKYGVPYAGLSGAALFADGGKLGVAFVATMIFDRQAGKAQQDVFVAWF